MISQYLITSDKLNKLADFLEFEVKEEKFRMSDWINSNDNLNLNECGTTACAFGWATEIWPDDLKFERLEYGVVVTYGEYRNYQAAANFFEINMEDAYDLFDHSFYGGYESKQEVVNRLREVANKYKEAYNA